ncbi:DUF421 domain-containing protein [Paenibacillus sp. TRM 82003]|nr:DUF421 domain-containing protein [Paenibacillus sp. TRM 82003]
MTWWEMGLRAAAVFLALLVWARMLGKKLISQMTFFDFVAGVAIGSFGTQMIFNRAIPFWVTVVALSIFCAMAILSDVVSLKSILGRKAIDGEPLPLVRKGQILEEGMAKSRLTMEGLLMQLRKKNVFYLDEVELAFFEIDGSVSVLRKPEAAYATKQDVSAPLASRGRPQVVVIDGKVLKDSLREAGKDEAWLDGVLRKWNIEDVSEVAFLQVDEADRVFLDKKADVLQ